MDIYGLQKLTLLDYPKKTACTVFSGGCNFRCPFCHNGDLVLGNFPGKMDEDEFFAFLKKRAGILDGVCITGGEPLLNKDIVDFAKKIRDLGYSVKLDTNGSFPERLAEIAGFGVIDYVAMDIKNSKEMYSETVGVKNFDISPVLESADFLMKCGIDYEFRTTIVKEFHTEESIEALAEWIKGAKRYFLQNFVDSQCVIKKGLHAVQEHKLKKMADIAGKYVEQVGIRGI